MVRSHSCEVQGLKGTRSGSAELWLEGPANAKPCGMNEKILQALNFVSDAMQSSWDTVMSKTGMVPLL